MTAEQLQGQVMRELQAKTAENEQLREGWARLKEDKQMLRQECEEWEKKCSKLGEALKRLEMRAAEEIHDAREVAHRSAQYSKEVEYRLKKTEEVLAKDREQAERRLRLETEKLMDSTQRAEERISVLKEELRITHSDLALLRKNQQFLERRTAKQDKENVDEETLKSETKKLLALAVELVTDILNTARSDKALQGLHKAYVHRQMALEKKYQKLRVDLLNKSAGVHGSRHDKPPTTRGIEKKGTKERSRSGGSKGKTLVKQGSARSINSRGSVNSNRSQKSVGSRRSATKAINHSDGKRQVPQSPSATREKPRLLSSGKKRLGSRQREVMDVTRDSDQKRSLKQGTSDNTMLIHHLVYRFPFDRCAMLLGRGDDSKITEHAGRDSSVWGSGGSHLMIEERTDIMPKTREALKAEIHALEDQILSLKKSYKEQLGMGHTRTQTSIVALATQIEKLSDKLLSFRRELRLMDNQI